MVAAIVLFGLLFGRTVQAGAFDFNDGTWEGCTELLELARTELGGDRVVVLSVLDWQQVRPADGILLLHPMQAVDREDAAAFMKAGGRLAVLDDYGRGELLLAHFRIRRRSLPTRPLAFLRNKPALPVAEPAFDPAAGWLWGRHPTVARIDRVMLNHGTGLLHPDLTPVLEVRAAGEDPVTVAVAGQVGEGRLFAMGDPSAFINQMLRYSGNRRFAVGLVRYLVQRDGEDRGDGRLFVLANQFSERVGFGGVTPLRKALNRQLDELLAGLAQMRRDGFPWWLHILGAAFAGLVLVWWVVRSLLKVYHSRVPHFAEAVPLVAQRGIAGRVAVLSAASTAPAIALFEIRNALIEALAHRFDLPTHTSTSRLLQEAEAAAGQDGQLKQALAEVRQMVRTAEAALVPDVGPRVTRGDVARAGKVVHRVLEACGADFGPQPRG